MRQSGRLGGVATGAVAVVAVVVASLGAPSPAPATAPGTRAYVVHGTTGFPAGRDAQLSYVGCERIFERSPDDLTPMIGRGDVTPPAGTRSLGYDLVGGNAVGSLHYVASMQATTRVGLWVQAPQGTTGVAYAGYQAPTQRGTTRMWFGRASLAVRAGEWQEVEAVERAYEWSELDTRTGAPVDPTAATVTATPHQFSRAHGPDGAGLFTIGFGCDGNRFDIDKLSLAHADGLSTYDLEGLRTAIELAGPRQVTVLPGESVTLQPRLRDGAGHRLDGAVLVLQAKRPGGAYETVSVHPAGEADPVVTVTPVHDTVYRFVFADRPMADGSVSDEVRVEVRRPEPPAPTPSPGTDSPAETTAPEPAPSKHAEPTKEPTEEREPSEEPEPSKESSKEPSQESSPDSAVEPAPDSVVEPTIASEARRDQPAGEPAPDQSSEAQTTAP